VFKRPVSELLQQVNKEEIEMWKSIDLFDPIDECERLERAIGSLQSVVLSFTGAKNIKLSDCVIDYEKRFEDTVKRVLPISEEKRNQVSCDLKALFMGLVNSKKEK